MTPMARRGSPPRILVLGGSAEGFAAADALTALGYEVVTSFAGRTNQRRAPAGLARVGGFGGAEGLAVYLAVEDIALVVDATHPFASRIKAHAAAACADVGATLIQVERPAWAPEPGDDWRLAPDVATAATIVPTTDGPCFVTVGRQGLKPFEARTDLELLIRVIDPPETPYAHPRAEFLCDRGPFSLEAERALFERRRIGCVVAKNSGGAAAQAKLIVAREKGVPVVMVERPAPVPGVSYPTVEEAVAAAAAMLRSMAA
jgi:precorrin-6A/cobalt-precorrin-6A reductase